METEMFFILIFFILWLNDYKALKHETNIKIHYHKENH